jgi:hypothetical protein
VEHREREGGRLADIEAAQVDSHQERRHLVVGHLAGDERGHEAANVVGGEGTPVPLGGDELDDGSLHMDDARAGRPRHAQQIRVRRGRGPGDSVLADGGVVALE